MNLRLRVSISLSVILALAGCCPNGCFVLTGPAFEALANPRPMREDWNKNNASDEAPRTDWENCGGYRNGNFVPLIELVRKERRPEEKSDSPAYDRLYLELQRCMLRKGYPYIGKCYDNEISRSLPACGAP